MKWLDFYNNEYKKVLNEVETLRNSDFDNEKICKEYVNLVNVSCELMKLFLNYQGLFQFEYREVIKEAFYVELISDGELWINALSLAEVYESSEKERFYPLIISYLQDENFYIFNKLKDRFDKIKAVYE